MADEHPAVAQVLREGLDLGPGVTFLVGENGSGKSTLVEGIAIAYGLSPEGGSRQAQHRTRPTESPLSDWLRLQRGVGAHRWGFFLRAETMHSFYTYLEENPSLRGDVPFHEMSHGSRSSPCSTAASMIRGSTAWTSRRPPCRSIRLSR